jgi:hypothetical protein
MSLIQKVGEAHAVNQTSDRLAGLLERRAELEAEIRIVSAPEATRSAAAASLAKAEAELAALDAAERSAWLSWSENPASEQPTPRHDERRQLEQRRALAAADLRGASAACEAVEHRINAINAALKLNQREMLRLKIDDLLAEAKDINDAAHVRAAELRLNLQRLYGVSRAFDEEIAAAASRGDRELLDIFAQAQTQFETLKQPHLNGEAAQIERPGNFGRH